MSARWGSTIVFLLAACLRAASPVATEPGSLAAVELQDLFTQANELFREANAAAAQSTTAEDLYRRAALRLERIVREGNVRNGKLFYNLGNAYFRGDDIGRAILNYRRAQQYIPGDSNLAENLEYARRSRADAFEEQQATRVLRTLLFWHYDLSPGLRSMLFAVFSGVFWIAAGVRLFRKSWAPRWLLLTAAIPGTLLLASLLVESSAQAGDTPGVVIAEEVVARKGDGQSYEPSFEEPLHAGAEFTLVESRGDWSRIELPDGRQCWVPASATEVVPLR
jgi:tetratricopeptide (TPR) repeat protein